MAGASRIWRDLRRARILVVHPRDEDGDVLVGHLRRLGCEVRATWPFPAVIPADIDTVFLNIDEVQIDQVLGQLEEQQPAVIAIASYESPIALQAIMDLNAHGVIIKPLRTLGILTQFALARYRKSYERRLAGKVNKLEEAIKGRRSVEKAVIALQAVSGLDEEAAYKLLREQATEKRVPMSVIAENVISAQETMKSLALPFGKSGK